MLYNEQVKLDYEAEQAQLTKAKGLVKQADKLAITNPAKAFALYTEAAGLGLLFPLGKFHMEAPAPYADTSLALQYLNQICEDINNQGTLEARNYLGHLYFEGIKVDKDLEKSSEHFVYIVRNYGHLDARLMMARCKEESGLHTLALASYADVLCVNPQHTEARKRLKALAEAL